MAVYPLMRAEHVAWSPLPFEEVRRRLERAHTEGRLSGTVGHDGDLSLQYRVPGVKNSWRPEIRGRIGSANGGTLLHVRLRVNTFVFLFTVVHGLFLLGISWLMGIAAFSWEAGKAIAALDGMIGATASGREAVAAAAPVGDPTVPGAEADAPPGLCPVVDAEAVRLTVRGPHSIWSLGAREEVEIVVSAARLELRLPNGLFELTWDELERVAVDVVHGVPVLTVHASGDEQAVYGNDHAESDLIWLAAYLESFAARRRGSPEELARHAADRAAISRVMQAVAGESEPGGRG